MDEDVAAPMLTNPIDFGTCLNPTSRKCPRSFTPEAVWFIATAPIKTPFWARLRVGVWASDVLHFTLHKTFLYHPSRGGGPGLGPGGGKKKILEPYLPVPVIQKWQAEFMAQ